MTDDVVRLDRLRPALVAATGDAAWSQAQVRLISGGKSNLTFAITSSAGELVLRRPPTGELLPSAHDMLREARVQQALASTGVPVAGVVLVDDGGLLDVPCYVMEKVEGHVVRGELPPGYAETPADRERLANAFVDTLATLHAVDPRAVGLGDYGRPVGFMARQVRRWTGQWEASRTHDVAEVTELGRRLAACVPDGPERAAVVHGDYRLDNVVLDRDDPCEIAAVLDWELSTLGDPLTDVGLVTLFWRGPDEPALSLIPGVTHLPGFPGRDHLLERYAAGSGTDLGDLAFYRAFAHFKFAVIAQGVATRSAAGTMGGQDFGDLDDEILSVAHAGLELT